MSYSGSIIGLCFGSFWKLPGCFTCLKIKAGFLQLEGPLEEMLVLCQRAEEYTQFILEAAAGASSPGRTPAARENQLRSGQFNTAVRELMSYYINLVGRSEP